MAFEATALADGQVDTTAAELYTAPLARTAYIKQVRFFNTNAADQTLLVYLNRSGTDRLIRRVTLEQYDHYDLIEDASAILLAAGDSILAETTTATAVNYFVDGVEES